MKKCKIQKPAAALKEARKLKGKALTRDEKKVVREQSKAFPRYECGR